MSNAVGFFRRSWMGARDFFRGCVQELRNVRWPNRREMVHYTIVVLVVVAILTLFIFLVDLALQQLFSPIYSS
ncbi:preprotein translocase subunit SecE [Pasteuria penetrans]|uniref:preprotein translocase subunit SecE n=1 Tax=Pasteuria penetrans TaxID=86005 RepID=UPI000F9F2099|nr:preprotein translocase subunit SecE [Pasteuria penetrans]